MKKLLKIILYIFLLIGVVILSLCFYVLIVAIQRKLFLPEDYIMWIFKFPYSRLVFIYEIYILIGVFCIFNKNVRELIKVVINLKEGFIKRHRSVFISTFIIINIVLLYTILINVTVIIDDKIIDYTFLSPQGKEYVYGDIVKIETGVYGKKPYVPFTHSVGDFYYIIQFNDGTKIDITELGGAKNDNDPRFIIEKLDSQYVNMGISKISSMDNFKYCTKHLDKIYTDKIRIILENVR